MNVILLDPDELSEGTARLTDRRHAHVRGVLRSRPGDELVVGELNGRLGRGRVVEIDDAEVVLQVELDRDPPPALPVSLVVALPRPPSLRKLLHQATAMGVKRMALIGSQRVDKSFWQSSALRPEQLHSQLRLGLEQARDTRLPSLELHKRFRSFAQEVLPGWAAGTRLLLGQAGAPPPGPGSTPATLVVGPEGDFLPREVEMLRAAGAQPVGVGVRPLRVETAVVALLGALASGC